MAINYRIGMSNTGSLDDNANALYRATQDLRAAVRWTKAHVDSIGVDTQQIKILGYSAGAIAAWHAMFWEQNEVPNQINTNNLGLLDDGLYLNYSSDFQSIISAAGGIGNLNWMSYKPNKTFFTIHNIDDPLVPIDSNLANGITPINGARRIQQRLFELGYDSVFQATKYFSNEPNMHLPQFGSTNLPIWGTAIEQGSSNVTFSPPTITIARTTKLTKPDRVQNLFLRANTVLEITQPLAINQQLYTDSTNRLEFFGLGKLTGATSFYKDLPSIHIRNMVNPLSILSQANDDTLFFGNSSVEIDSCTGNFGNTNRSRVIVFKSLTLNGNYDTLFPLSITSHLKYAATRINTQVGKVTFARNSINPNQNPTLSTSIYPNPVYLRCAIPVPRSIGEKQLIGNPFISEIPISELLQTSSIVSAVSIPRQTSPFTANNTLRPKAAYFITNGNNAYQSGLLRIDSTSQGIIQNLDTVGTWVPFNNPLNQKLDLRNIMPRDSIQRTLCKYEPESNSFTTYQPKLGLLGNAPSYLKPLEACYIYLPAGSNSNVKIKVLADSAATQFPVFTAQLPQVRIQVKQNAPQAEKSECLLLFNEDIQQDSALAFPSNQYELSMRKNSKMLLLPNAQINHLPLYLQNKFGSRNSTFAITACINCDSLYLRTNNNQVIALDSIFRDQIEVPILADTGTQVLLGHIERTITTAINNKDANTILKLFPNPASHEVVLSSTNSWPETTPTIMDLTGKTRNISIIRKQQNELVLDITSLEAGVYLVKQGNSFGKLLVK